MEVAGDFDFEVRFDQLKYEVPAGKIGYVRVGVDATEEARERAVIQLGGNREGDQVVQCMRGTVLKGADRSHYFEMQPAEADTGRLRFSRRGSTIYYLYAENDSSQFRLLAEQEYVGANILQAGLQFGVHMQGPGGRVSVRIREVSVRAAGLEGPALRDSNATLVRLNKEREDLPERYAEDFADFPLAESTYLVWANGNTPASDSKGVLIHAAGHSSWSSSGFGIPNQYTGDFDIKYRFDDPNLLHPEERKHTQVYLQLEYDDDENTQLSAMLTRSAAGTYYSQAQVRSRPAGSYKYTNLATVPYSDPDFLRILRRGEEVYFLAGNEGRQEEFLMASAPIGDAPLNRYGVRVMLHTGAAEGESTVYARSLTVHAESEVVPEAIRRAAPLTNPVQPDESLPARLLNSLREIFP